MNWIRTILGRVKAGKIELSEFAQLEEGMQGLVTLVPADEAEFWQGVSQVSLQEVWDDPADDIYAELLQK